MSDNTVSGTATTLEQFISAVDQASNHGKARVIAEVKDGQVNWHREGRFAAIVRWLGFTTSASKQNRNFVEAVQFLKNQAAGERWNGAAQREGAIGSRVIQAVETLESTGLTGKKNTIAGRFLDALQQQGVSVSDISAAKFQESAATSPAPVRANANNNHLAVSPPNSAPPEYRAVPGTQRANTEDIPNQVATEQSAATQQTIPPRTIAFGEYTTTLAQKYGDQQTFTATVEALFKLSEDAEVLANANGNYSDIANKRTTANERVVAFAQAADPEVGTRFDQIVRDFEPLLAQVQRWVPQTKPEATAQANTTDAVTSINEAVITPTRLIATPSANATHVYEINYAQESRRLANAFLEGDIVDLVKEEGLAPEALDRYKSAAYRLLDRADQGADPEEIKALQQDLDQAAIAFNDLSGYSSRSAYLLNRDHRIFSAYLQAITEPPVVNARPPNALPPFVSQQGDQAVVTSSILNAPNPPVHPLTTPPPEVLTFITSNREQNITREDLVERQTSLATELLEQGPSQFRTVKNEGITYPLYMPGQSTEEWHKQAVTGALSDIVTDYKGHASFGDFSFDSSSPGFIAGKRYQTELRDAGNKFHISVPPGQYKQALDAIAPLLGSPDNPFGQWKVTNPATTRPTSHVHAAEQFTLYANPESETWESHKTVGGGRHLDAGRYSADLIKRQADFILAIEARLVSAGIGVQDVPASDIRAPQWQYASYTNDTMSHNLYAEHTQRKNWTADQAEQPYYKLVSQVAP